MNRILKHFFHRPRTEADFMQLALQQLSQIFPFVYKQHELRTEEIPSLLVDILARSTNGQLLLFEIKYFPSNVFVDYSIYPSIAAFKDSTRVLEIESPPVVAVITNNGTPEPVRNIFAKSRIPVISLGNNAKITRSRLQNAFEQMAISLPEFTSDTEIQEGNIEQESSTEKSLPYKQRLILWEYIEKINTNLFIFINIFLSVILGIVLTVTGKLLFAECVVLAGIIVAGLILYLKDRSATISILNPYIIVLKEEKKLVVKKDAWLIEKHILFKARRKKVDSYLFHVDWAGSSQKDIKITCRDEDGTITQKNVVTSKVMNWPLWELKFARPVQKGEMRQIVLKYSLPDPAHKAPPYYFMSYKNFWQCKEFLWRLSLADDIKPDAVYFVKGIWPDKALKKARIPLDVESNEYVVHEWPERESKESLYSFEWEFKNGAD